MPSYAIKSSGIRQVAANSLIGNSTGSTGSAEELSATDAKTLLGLGTSDAPTFAGQIIKGTAYIQSTGGATRWALQGNANLISQNSTGGPSMGGTVPYSFVGDTSTGIDTDGSGTLLLIPDTNAVEQRNGTNAQIFRIYNTDDGSQTNYGRASIGWDSNVFAIDVEASGTGAQGTFVIRRAGQSRISFPSNSSVTIHKSLYPSSNGSIPNGWSSLRWSNVYSVKSDISQTLTLASHTPATTTNKLYNVGGTLYFNGSAAGGNPFDQNLNTTDSPTFASATIGNMTLSDVGSYDSITSGDARLALRAQDGSMELYLHNKSDGNDSFRFNTNNGIFELFSDADNQIDLRNGTSANALNVYNTWTDASNYERLSISGDGTDFTVSTAAAGTGTQGDLIFAANGYTFSTTSAKVSINGQSGNTSLETARAIDAGTGAGVNYGLFRNANSAGTNFLRLDTVGDTLLTAHTGYGVGIEADGGTEIANFSTSGVTVDNTFTGSSGVESLLSLTPTYNQTGTAGGTDILVNRTETAVGSGDQNLMDLQVGGTSKFKVDNAGSAYLDNIYHSSGGGRLQLGSSGYTLYAELSCNRLLPRADGTYDLGAETLAWNNIKNTGSILCYNGGASDSTNYERGFLEWDSNVFTIGTQAAGTGTDRGINFVTGGTTRGGFNTSGKLQAGSKIYLHATATSNQPYITNSADYLAVSSQKGFLASHFSDRTSGDVHTFTQSSSSIEMTDTDGPQSFMSITPRVGQSGTAAYNGLKIDITESSLGDGSTGDGNNAILATVGGISKFKVSNAGMITTAGGNGSGTAGGLMLGNSIGWISRGTGSVELASGAAEYVEIASDGITLRTGDSFGWSANNNPQDSAGPRFWENTSTETIELRRGTTALGFAVANTWTDANNLEFGVFDWTTTANTLHIGTQAAGTGTVRDLVLATGGTETIKVAGSNQRVTISADRTAIGSGSSHSGVLNLGGDRVMTFHGGNSSIRCPSGQLDFRTATSVFTLVGNTIRFKGYDGGGFLNIRNYSTGGAGTVVIRKLASQTSDLLKVLDDSGNNLFNLQHTGDFVLGLNSTTNPDIYSYGLFTDNSNYERLKIEAGTAYNIRVQAAGTGTGRDLNIHSGASAALRLGVDGTNYIIMTSSGVKPAQDLFPNANNSYKNGTTSNRWSETNTVDLNSTGGINFSGLPTSSSGLSTGDLYLQSSGVPGGDYQIMVKA